MRVSDKIEAERLSADEAYQRFFDGYYNLGCPGEVFLGTMVLSPQRALPKRRARLSTRIPRRRAANRPR